MFYFERKFKSRGFKFIIGVDEAGRGPLAGPVVAGAVLLRRVRFKSKIIDSKKLTPLQREKAFLEIIRKAVFNIGIVNERVIDQLNIQEATRLAMEHAIDGLILRLNRTDKGSRKEKKKICILVDGNIKLNTRYPYVNIIKGDNRSKSIAAASIVAKFMRDGIMSLYSRLYPRYGFLKHKGYPTRMHRMQLEKFGPTQIHRVSFLKNPKRLDVQNKIRVRA